ncbi:MAG: chemotaxis protein CheA [Candidatus Latescibacteria bacterium]|nr:chemotaxis protein CheA [Candidatus Latescibacterota bacterium]
MDRLSEEAILLEPGKVHSCGKMLSLLDELQYPGISEEKRKLKEYLESMILQDLEGGSVEIDNIVKTVERLQALLRGNAPAEKHREAGSGNGDGGENNPDETIESFDLDDDDDDDEKETTGTVDAGVRPEPEPAPPAAGDIPEDDDEVIIEDVDLLMDFIAEAREHLDSIDLSMVEWERNPKDKEIINSIFRPFHTIKGVAGFLNLKKINQLSHQLENLLDEAREGKVELTPELSDLIFDGADILRGMISAHEEAVTESRPVRYGIDIPAFIQRISMVMNSARVEDDDKEAVGDKQPLGEILVKEGKIKEDDLKNALEKQSSSENPKPVGELLVEEKKLSARDVRDAIRKQTELSKPKVDKYIKVDTHKMDLLLDMVGELVIAQSMVQHNPDALKISNQRFIRDISQLSRVTSTLQNISMSMRLVPIGATFQKMNRIVRDLSRKSGKKINLVLKGETAEIDRNMVEELYDPLVHMIRNSCDHGIQAPDKRTAVGKPAEGTIELKAEHAGGKIVIIISDDGEGLDRDRILSIAREKGLWTDEENPDNTTIDNFIFAPGFSTAREVTDVSGRGVGMDVVRKAIEKLHGTVEIESIPGSGTTFTIKLPLTTAIIDGMVVELGGVRYIIPTLNVRQLAHPKKEDINNIVGRGKTVKLRGSLLPLFRLGDVLGVSSKTDKVWEGVLVIVEDGGREVALQVDSVIGKQEVVIKNLGEKFNNMQGIAGGAILGDGRVGLILDIRSLTSIF